MLIFYSCTVKRCRVSEQRYASPCILPRISDQVVQLVFDSELAGQTTARSEGPN